MILVSCLCYAQAIKPDVILSPNGPNTSVYWNVKFKTLILPHFNKNHIPHYQGRDTMAGIFVNADTTDKHVYVKFKGDTGYTALANVNNIISPAAIDVPQGSPNPVYILNYQSVYSGSYGNLANILVEVRNTNAISSLNTLIYGTGGTDGSYQNVPLTGGTGADATADITIAGGIVTTVTLKSTGFGYVAGDVLSASVGSVTGFSITVGTVGKTYQPTTLQAIKVMDDSTGLLLQYFYVDNPNPSDATITADDMRIIIKH